MDAPEVNLTHGSEVYVSITACAKARNIPKRIILAASKERPRPVGMRDNYSIAWAEFQPWLIQNYSRLTEVLKDDEPRLNLQEEKLVEEIRKLKNFNKKQDKAYINRRLVIQTFAYVSKKVSEILNAKFEYELPPKLAGLGEVEIKERLMKVRDEILKQFQTPLHEWETFQDQPENDDEQDPDTII